MSYREPHCKTTTFCFDVIFLSLYHLHSRSTNRQLLVFFDHLTSLKNFFGGEEIEGGRVLWRDVRPPLVLDTFVSKQADEMIRSIAILFYTGVLLHPLKPPKCEFLCFFFFLLTQFASDFSCSPVCSSTSSYVNDHRLQSWPLLSFSSSSSSSFLRCPQTCWWLFRHFRWCSQSLHFSSGHKSLKFNFRILRSVDTDTVRNKKRKKSFGIYWEGDDTFDLKVPSGRGGGTELHPGGVRSSPWLCRGRRCCFCSLCDSWSVGIGGCWGFFHLQTAVWGQGTSHTLDRWWSCTAWWGVWSGVCTVGLTISVAGACLRHLRCSDVGSARSVLPFSGLSEGCWCVCRCGGPTLHLRTQWCRISAL